MIINSSQARALAQLGTDHDASFLQTHRLSARIPTEICSFELLDHDHQVILTGTVTGDGMVRTDATWQAAS